MRGYDSWKAREPDYAEPFGECAYCNIRAPLYRLWTIGWPEQWICNECAEEVEAHFYWDEVPYRTPSAKDD